VGVAALRADAFAQAAKVGAEFRVNGFVTYQQAEPALAVDGSGGFVIVWQSFFQDRSLYAVVARRFSSAGAALASEFQVNTYTPDGQTYPTLAMRPGGDFVVAWVSQGQDGGITGVFARRFSSVGAPLAIEFQVNTYTPGTQNNPSAAIDADGDFVVAWDSNNDVFARRFSSAGAAFGDEFKINTFVTGSQLFPAVAMDRLGDFIVVWQSDLQDASGFGIFARRFSSAGVSLSGELQVNSYTGGGQRNPSAAVDAEGNFLVAWSQEFQVVAWHPGVFARRFSASSVKGPEIQVNSHPFNAETRPSVSVDGDGDFVVAWDSYQDGSLRGVFARRIDAAGTALASEFQVNSFSSQDQRNAAVGMDVDGDFVIAWESYTQDGSGFGVFAQRFDVPKTFDFDASGAADPLTDGLLFLRYLFGFRGTTLVTGAVGGNCTRCTPFLLETYLGVVVASTLTKSVGPEFQVNSYTGGDQSQPAAAASSAGNFVLIWDSEHDGSQGGIFARRFDGSGAPQSGELQVNQYVADVQTRPTVAMDADGDFVVAWESDTQDGSGYGVFARRFNAAGVPQASEFQVNSYTPGAQAQPAITMRGAGDFVVAWNSDGQDGSDYGVFARRFNAVGVPQASEFRVSVHTPNYQADAALGIDGAGGFVVVWTSVQQDGSESGVFARRFDAAGVPQASEFRVNSDTLSYQDSPSIAVSAGGDFVVTWQSYGQDGSLAGIFVRRFDNVGGPLGAEFQVNSYTAGSQYRPVISSAGGGGFVVVWQSYAQDSYGGGVFARRFNAAGVAQTNELQVNTYVSSFERAATVAADAGGDFVVGWESVHDGSGDGVFAQRFAVSLSADIDGDGTLGALTDGLLLLRYLFGFRGATLVTGAVGGGCTRCTAAAIESYLAAKV
jgi:hypothetical protein